MLEEPDQNGICHAQSTIALEDYIEDPLIALTFRIVFQATLPVRPVPRNINHTVAWQVYMPKINFQGQV